MFYRDPQKFFSLIEKKLTFKRLILICASTCSLSLVLIACRLSPISEYSKSMNRCIHTTSEFLASVPGFQSAGDDGLDAMSTSLCNGSTPQQADRQPN